VEPLAISRALCGEVETLHFSPPVTHVYNPLIYAKRSFRQYIQRYGKGPRPVLLLGMNPGPWGMAQTGVPFGEVTAVRDWLGIEAKVDRPAEEHPKRPVSGFDCPRREVSGARLWGWAQARFGTPARFFRRFQVVNYCPLAFMEASGRNRTPDKLPAGEREPLFAACDLALVRLVAYHRAEWVIGIGAFAETRARIALAKSDVRIGRVLHPSPASPLANRGWAERAEQDLAALDPSLDLRTRRA